MELQLREFDRCRKLYEKFLEFGPENCTSWIKFAELETILGDIERARAIYELAISQPRLDMPEVRILSWIEFCFRHFSRNILDDHLNKCVCISEHKEDLTVFSTQIRTFLFCR